MMQVHKQSLKPFTIGLFRSNNPSLRGIVTLDSSASVIDFEQQLKAPKSDLAKAGIYIMNTNLFDKIQLDNKILLDIGFDLLPKLINQM